MGSRDKGHKEQKKQKKDAKKILPVINTEAPPPVVEVIKRGKKERPEEV
jgi:hypothetical protein